MVTLMIMMFFLRVATFQIILLFNTMFIKLLFIFLQLYTQERKRKLFLSRGEESVKGPPKSPSGHCTKALAPLCLTI